MGEKKNVSVYHRADNISQMSEEEQIKIVTDAALLDGGYPIQDGGESSQSEKLINDMKNSKVSSVTLLEKEEKQNQAIERLKQTAGESAIPLQFVKNVDLP